MAKRRKSICVVCGRLSVSAGECRHCGVRQADYDDLRLISTLPTVTLRCPCMHGIKRPRRCNGKYVVSQSAFEQREGVAGNGPNGYLLACRHRLQHRCEKCGTWLDASDWISNNRPAIKRFAARLRRRKATP